MTMTRIEFGGETLLLDPAGALVWPSIRLLCVSDLHLEKGSHFAERGRFLPPYDTRETLSRLTALLERHRPARLILLGDSFHDPRASERLDPRDRARIDDIARTTAIVWVLGNHDPTPPCGLPGIATEAWTEGGLVFRHIGGGDGHEISGHFHPRASAATRAGVLHRPCFVTDRRRLMLPAFGAYAGGLDIDDPALAALFPGGADVFLLGKGRLHAFRNRGVDLLQPTLFEGTFGR